MHGTPTTSKSRVFGRDSSGSGGGLSTGTIVIIAVVCGCVVILALTLFLWRLLARCCRSKESAPLPPVQDLAHHRREQQRTAFANGLGASSRPVTWVDSLGPSRARTPYTSSAVSLLTNPENNASVYTDDMMTTESSLPSPDGDNKLYPPNPSFYRSSDASSSRNTLNDNASSSHSSFVSPSPPMPISESPSSASQATSHSRTQSRQASITHPPSSRSRSRIPSRGRPLSQASDSPTSHSGFTVRSSSTFRGGAPHRSGSVQIVLPTPLGPQPLYAGEGHALYHNPQVSRSSVFADQWLTSNNGTQNSSAEPTRREGRSSSKPRSRSRSRHRQTASVPDPPSRGPVPPGSFRRPATQHSRSQTSLHQLPEVPSEPRAPAYSNLADLATSAYDSNAVRERSRSTDTRLQRIPSGQVS